MNNHNQEMFYEQVGSRSPGSQRHQQQNIHRQPSRQFDPYGQMPNSAFSDDSAPRYDSNRFDRINNNNNNNNNNNSSNNSNMQGAPEYYPPMGAQSWNPSAFTGGNLGGASPFNAFGTIGGRMKPSNRGRTNLPPTWLDQQAPAIPTMNNFNPMAQSGMDNHQYRNNHGGHNLDNDEELIPTAIVIKNIPFAVKKEQLVDLMSEMNMPLPYAFNYHFDQGVFRGLAFANFTSPEETAVVISALNHYELQGRKLRVEYKKMLPLQERERIEREKRERRGQLEEQHRPMNTPALQNQHSMSSLSSHVPVTNSPSPDPSRPGMKPDMDLNDPQTLQFYSQLFAFKQDHTREALIFPANLAPAQRRTVHTLAHHLQLEHISVGNGDQRQVHVSRLAQGNNISPPLTQNSAFHADPSRRVLNRAATTDFSEARASDAGLYGTLRGQHSGGLLGVPDSPGGYGNRNELRAAKSFADLRSYTPSPVPSSASFPAALQSNVARFQDSTITPNLTPTASGSQLGQQQDNMLNGFGSMSIGSQIAPGPSSGSPRRLRGMFSWDGPPAPATAPIGSQRNFSMANYIDPSRDRNPQPIRQPTNPSERGAPGFARNRQNGHQARGSDEMRHSQPEIIVE